MAKNEQIKKSFLEANHALLQTHSLANIGQENYTEPENENIYNLLGVIDEKIVFVLKFFADNESNLEKLDG
jgi:hypothetical protein